MNAKTCGHLGQQSFNAVLTLPDLPNSEDAEAAWPAEGSRHLQATWTGDDDFRGKTGRRQTGRQTGTRQPAAWCATSSQSIFGTTELTTGRDSSEASSTSTVSGGISCLHCVGTNRGSPVIRLPLYDLHRGQTWSAGSLYFGGVIFRISHPAAAFSGFGRRELASLNPMHV